MRTIVLTNRKTLNFSKTHKSSTLFSISNHLTSNSEDSFPSYFSLHPVSCTLRTVEFPAKDIRIVSSSFGYRICRTATLHFRGEGENHRDVLILRCRYSLRVPSHSNSLKLWRVYERKSKSSRENGALAMSPNSTQIERQLTRMRERERECGEFARQDTAVSSPFIVLTRFTRSRLEDIPGTKFCRFKRVSLDRTLRYRISGSSFNVPSGMLRGR